VSQSWTILWGVGGRPVDVEWVRYGEAAAALRARLARVKGGDPLAPATVVVPSNAVGVATRRLLASGRAGAVCERGVGLAAVTFVTPYRLAELLGAARLAATGRRPVSTPVLAAALRSELAVRPGLFAPVAAHPATEAALVEAYRELREVPAAGLDALAAAGRRAADVVRLHRGTRARLRPGWYDEQDLMASAAEALGDASSGAARSLGAVVVHLPQRLPAATAWLLAVAMAASEGGAVVAGTTGVPAADAEVVAAVARLVPGAPGPPTFDPHAGTEPSRTRIVTASDADDETRAAVRAVVDAVHRGVPLGRIAVLHSGSDPYARLATEHLHAAGIRTNGPAVVPLAARVTGRLLLDLLALPEHGFRRQDVFAWLSSAPLRSEGRALPVVRWEGLSRSAGVVAGRADWDERLARLADDLDVRAAVADADPDGGTGIAEWRRADAVSARDLRAFVLALLDDLAAGAAAPRPWSVHAAWAGARLRALLGPPAERRAWPEAERKGAERTEAALDRLATLDDVEGPVGLEVFARTLALEFEADLGRVGRLGEGVLVAPVAMGVGLDVDLVVVLGLAEGSFPAPVRDDTLLPDLEREGAGGGLALRRQRVDRQHRQLLAVLAGGREHVLAVPRGDLRHSTERTPSRWVLDVASALAGRRCWAGDLEPATVPGLAPVASFAAGLRGPGAPATGQEHRLRRLLAAPVPSADALVEMGADPTLERAAMVVAARRSARFTAFDGNLAGLAVPSPVDRPTSTTRMERWARCPFDYLLTDVLGVEAAESPEDALAITALDRGTLVHEVLERFLAEVLRRPPEHQPAPDDAWTPADRARMAALGEEVCAELHARGVTGRALFWRRDRARILADLQRFLTADDTMRSTTRTRPVAAELDFGLGGLEAVPIALPDGRRVRFRGRADRIDRADDGSLHVLDYKTGRSEYYRGLSEEEPDERGRRLQLAIYGVAARVLAGHPAFTVLAEYWFVSSRGRFARIGYRVTDQVLVRVRDTLGAIVAGIEAGVFPARPAAGSTKPFVDCSACDPDGLGEGDLRRAWERKCLDPALAAYAALAEPIEGLDADVEASLVTEVLDAR